VNDNTTSQPRLEPAPLPQESPAKPTPRLEAAKSRVANLLHAFAPKKKATHETPAPSVATPEAPVQPVIGSDKAALFLDAKGNIVGAQPRCASFFGRHSDELGGLNIKDLLKPGFDQEVSNILVKGQSGTEMSFHVLALQKDGSEFPTQFSFKYLPEDFGFCWTVFVQAPPGGVPEIQQIVPTTETVTTETAKPQAGEKPPAQPVGRSRSRNPERLAAQLEVAQNECKRLERVKFEADKHVRQLQTDYGNRLIQLEEDLSAERQINETLSKRLEAQEQSVTAQIKGMQKIREQRSEPADSRQKTQAEIEELKRQQQALESEAAGIRKERDELQGKLSGSQEDPKAKAQLAELTAKLEKISSELQTSRKGAEENEAARKQLKADLDKEREANKLSQKKAEELHAQFQKLKGAAEEAEARVRESAARCSDWEKKVADLGKTTDELSRSHAAGKSASAQSAQRIKELEQQFKDANTNLATGKTEAEKQASARQKLEAENRSLTEASARTKAELDKEREANKLARKKEEELNTQVQKLQKGVEQAETRFQESAAQSRDSEKKVAEVKKTVDELIRAQAAEKSSSAQSAQRIKELEQNLKDANANIATGKAEIEKQNAARQKVEAENRNLTEANAKTKSELDKEREANKRLEQNLRDANANVASGKTELEKQNSARQKVEAENRNLTEANARANADLDMERDAHKLFRHKAEELSAQFKNLQYGAEQAEVRVRESVAQSKDSEKKAAELKKSVDELTRSHAAEKTAGAQSAQRIRELEQQIKRSGDDLAASKTEVEKQNSARQKLETDNRNVTETGAKAKADLEKEREALKLSRKKEEELNAQIKNLQLGAEQAEARVRESAAQSKDWEKKAAELKKSIDELTRSHATEQNAGAQSAQRVKELEQQFKRASDEFAASKAEAEKQQSTCKRLEAENRELAEGNAKFAESAKNQAALQKRASELEQRVREGVASLAKATADLQSERIERERAEKCASSATTHLQQVNEKLDRQLELERTYRTQVAELEKTIHDRGDDLARASAALRKETKERQMAQKQSRLVSEMGDRLESNLASLDDAKKTFEALLDDKDGHLQIAEHTLAKANSDLEKESAERRRAEGLLADAKRQLEKVSGESKVEISRLQAALDLLELQRKQLEVDLLRSRDIENGAEQGLGSTLENLRLELRQPVEDLRQSACSLLESPVTDEQKRAIGVVLEKALFVQVTLNAGAKPNSESNSQANERRVDSRNKKSESK
jgi:chromosome segregation ATPase